MYYEELNGYKRSFKRLNGVIPILSKIGYCIWNYIELDYEREHMINYEKDRRNIEYIRKEALKRIKLYGITVDKGLISIDFHGANYYHFLAYTLPDMLAMLRISKKYGLNYNSSIINDLPNYAYQYFNIFNIKERIYPLRNVPLSIKDCILPAVHYKNDLSFDHNNGILSIREYIDKSLLEKDISLPSKIFIERRTSNNNSELRKIFPQEELHNDLQKNGYTIIYMEDLTVIDQIKYFANARVAVALHGAALANIIYMDENSTLIEVGHEDGFPNVYEKLARLVVSNYKKVYLKGYLSKSEESQVKQKANNSGTNVLPLCYDEVLKTALFSQ